MTPKQIVKKLHNELHWSVERIAVAIPCSSDMVRRWLRGENEPRGERRRKLYELAERYLTNGAVVVAR